MSTISQETFDRIKALGLQWQKRSDVIRTVKWVCPVCALAGSGVIMWGENYTKAGLDGLEALELALCSDRPTHPQRAQLEAACGLHTTRKD